MAITKASAYAWSILDGTNVAITTVDFSNVSEEKGVYPVTFTTAKGTAITINAIVDYNTNVVIDPMVNESIIADDFKLSTDEVLALTDQNVIDKSAAYAWETTEDTKFKGSNLENRNIEITYIDKSKISNTKGVYPVTLATAKGTSITVNAIVGYDNNQVIVDDESIIADNFKLTKAEAQSIDAQIAITKASAYAWSLLDGTNVAITNVDLTKVKAEKGIYPVTFSTSKGTSITVEAIVGYETDTFALIFETNGADSGTIETQYVLYDTLATEPNPKPTKGGHSFGGWYSDPTLITEWSFVTSKMPANDVTLYAKWYPNSYTLSFDTNGAENGSIPSQTVVFDTLANQPSTEPTKAGNTFMGWYSDEGLNSIWNFETNKMPASNQILYAKWSLDTYELSFETNGADIGLIDTQYVLFDTLAIQPKPEPTKLGHTFVGWYSDEDFTSVWDFELNKMPAKNQTLYAKWNANSYSLSFETNGADSGLISNQNVIFGTLATKPEADPNKVGYVFGGWNTLANGLGSTWDFNLNTMPANDLVLYANWIETPYEVTFDLNGYPGSQPSIQLVEAGGLVTQPAMPLVIGYQLNGWYYDTPSGSVEWDFTTDKMPANNLILYADWKINEYTLSFETNEADSGLLESQKVVFNNLAIAPNPEPIKTGYSFGGWYYDQKLTKVWDFTISKMPANDQVLYAKWNANTYKLSFDLNGGTGINPEAQYVLFNEKTVNPGVVQYPGYKFIGWNTTGDISDQLWDFTNNTMPANDVVLYAIYSKEANSNPTTPDNSKPIESEKDIVPVVKKPVQKVEKEKLVETGENTFELFNLGIVMIVLSFFTFIKIKIKNK
jgi:uncharacterized repeat protein (TIGR02543 family)